MDQTGTRNSGWTFLLAAIVVSGSAGGAFWFHWRQNRAGPGDKTGFDIAEAPRPNTEEAAPAAPAPRAAPAPDSGLALLRTGGFPRAAAPAPAARARLTPRELAKSLEPQVIKLAQEYTRRYPLIRQYGKDWMSYPDLKKLNDAYMRDHDPVAFLHGVAASPNFAALVRKYAGLPPIQGFVKEAAMQTPPDKSNAALAYLEQDGRAKKLVQSVAAALGLPPGLFAGGADLNKIDDKAVMGAMLKNHPELEKATPNSGAPAVSLPAGASSPEELRRKAR